MGLRPLGAGHGSAPPPRGAAAPARPTQSRWRGRGVPCREAPAPPGSLGSPALPAGRALRTPPWVPWGTVSPLPQRGPCRPPPSAPMRPARPQPQRGSPQGASAFVMGFFLFFSLRRCGAEMLANCWGEGEARKRICFRRLSLQPCKLATCLLLR
ncbi:nascent polypeptide-associated complex subunit alpha, muscle-specific form-like [Pyrgilauda ruficollis]|uniref:nascent polypeptide-associated complex subunit alpha, muscle-specific form-like n=1 Tax=Pyrgilauda ruficollis TaxID=221976 RepID=UPI001B863926|nr:nascent polypeptide-associated complex subunit alpha, muscle-specific form-like [Pyrgilauda ruficollis]